MDNKINEPKTMPQSTNETKKSASINYNKSNNLPSKNINQPKGSNVNFYSNPDKTFLSKEETKQPQNIKNFDATKFDPYKHSLKRPSNPNELSEDNFRLVNSTHKNALVRDLDNLIGAYNDMLNGNLEPKTSQRWNELNEKFWEKYGKDFKGMAKEKPPVFPLSGGYNPIEESKKRQDFKKEMKNINEQLENRYGSSKRVLNQMGLNENDLNPEDKPKQGYLKDGNYGESNLKAYIDEHVKQQMSQGKSLDEILANANMDIGQSPTFNVNDYVREAYYKILLILKKFNH